MNIETKFNVSGVVWFLENNIAKQESIYAIETNSSFSYKVTTTITYVFLRAGGNSALRLEENKVFETKEDLLKSL